VSYRGSYLQFSSIAASCVRQCLKPDVKAAAMKRVEANLKLRPWSNGKPAAAASASTDFFLICQLVCTRLTYLLFLVFKPPSPSQLCSLC
jgi:hypothetical protein